MQFVHLASLNDLKTRKLICVKTERYRILIALAEGNVYAVDDMCTHEEASLSKGIAALNGERGSTYDALVYSAAIALWHVKKAENIIQAAEKVRKVLDDSSALKHFNAAP